jgi:hypothetical protein
MARDLNARAAKTWAEVSVGFARPAITVFVTFVYNGALLIAMTLEKLAVSDYILAVGPINAVIMGFWFGDRGSRVHDQPGPAACPPCNCDERLEGGNP